MNRLLVGILGCIAIIVGLALAEVSSGAGRLLLVGIGSKAGISRGVRVVWQGSPDITFGGSGIGVTW